MKENKKAPFDAFLFIFPLLLRRNKDHIYARIQSRGHFGVVAVLDPNRDGLSNRDVVDQDIDIIGVPVVIVFIGFEQIGVDQHNVFVILENDFEITAGISDSLLGIIKADQFD